MTNFRDGPRARNKIAAAVTNNENTSTPIVTLPTTTTVGSPDAGFGSFELGSVVMMAAIFGVVFIVCLILGWKEKRTENWTSSQAGGIGSSRGGGEYYSDSDEDNISLSINNSSFRQQEYQRYRQQRGYLTRAGQGA